MATMFSSMRYIGALATLTAPATMGYCHAELDDQITYTITEITTVLESAEVYASGTIEKIVSWKTVHEKNIFKFISLRHDLLARLRPGTVRKNPWLRIRSRCWVFWPVPFVHPVMIMIILIIL